MDKRVENKIDYLKQLKELLDSESLSVNGKQGVYERVWRTCNSIETDLGISPPS
jgi:hypothetical protein